VKPEKQMTWFARSGLPFACAVLGAVVANASSSAGLAEGSHGAVLLRAQAESFAGRPVLLDPRVSVPACGDGISIGWREGAGQALLAVCASSGWRLVIPLAGAGRMPTAPALVKRGDPVLVQAGGAGFAVRLEGVAESDARAGGRVMVRNARSGERVSAEVRPNGQLWLAGQGGAP